MNTCRHQAHPASHRPQVPLERPRAISGARTQRLAYAFAHGARVSTADPTLRAALGAIRCETLSSKLARSMMDPKAKRRVPVCFKSCGLLADRADESKSEGWRSSRKKGKRDRHECRSCSNKGAASSCSDDGGRYSIRAAATALKHAAGQPISFTASPRTSLRRLPQSLIRIGNPNQRTPVD
jgi:hypothetical protein